MKKILSLLIILTFICVCCLSACSPKNGDNGSDNIELKDADLLALSYDRLENADLSFNFSIEKSVAKLVASENYSNIAGCDAVAVSSVSDEKVYEVKPKDLPILEYSNNGGIFDFCKIDTNTMSEDAHSIVDYAIDNITVMDTCVVDSGGWKTVLKYDYQKDIVTVIKHEGTKGTQAWERNYIINVYYDEDGDETVEMWYYYWSWDRSGQVGVIDIKQGCTKHIIYTPNKYYNYSNYTWGCDDQGINKIYGTYQEAIAYKEDGEWRCMTQLFEKDHPFFTNGGVYDLVNGGLELSFYIEKDDVLYNIEKKINPYRDGYMLTGQGVLLLPDDEYKIEDMGLGRSGINIDYYYNSFDVDLSILKGWESVIISDTSKSLVLSNEDVVPLSSNTIWLPEYGWYTINGSIELDKDYNVVITLSNPYGWGSTDDKIVSFTLGLQFLSISDNRLYSYDTEIGEEQLQTIDAFLKDNGLSFIDQIQKDAMSDLSDVITSKSYTNTIYEQIYSCDLTVDHFKKTALEVVNKLDTFEKSFDNMLDEYDEISSDDMPKKPADIGLVSVSNKLVGELVITAEKMDFSGLELDINKSTILSSNNQYTVFVGWSNGSGTAFLDAFNMQTYDQQAMHFSGIADVPLPEAYEGDYTLVAFFGKQTDGGQKIRLSELVTKIPVKRFEPFETRLEVEDGYLLHQFYLENGLVKLKVTFVDTSEE